MLCHPDLGLGFVLLGQLSYDQQRKLTMKLK